MCLHIEPITVVKTCREMIIKLTEWKAKELLFFPAEGGRAFPFNAIQSISKLYFVAIITQHKLSLLLDLRFFHLYFHKTEIYFQ